MKEDIDKHEIWDDPEIGKRADRALHATEPDYDALWDTIRRKTISRPKRRIVSYVRIAAAVLIPFVVGTLIYWGMANGEKDMNLMKEGQLALAVEPAQSGVILKLSGGEVHNLSGMDGEKLASNGKVVIKVDSVATISSASKEIDTTLSNTLEVPVGEDYTLLLADGSKVILNSATKLYFPTGFGKERRVKLCGEAYFQVKSDPMHPFRVETENGNVVEALGTRFNVSAYGENSAEQATLVEGKVNVISGKTCTKLHPGEQANISAEGVEVSTVDVDRVLSWMNGVYSFSGVGIREIMKQVERWYGVKVVLDGRKLDNYVFTGVIDKKKGLRENLKAIEKTSDLTFEYLETIVKIK